MNKKETPSLTQLQNDRKKSFFLAEMSAIWVSKPLLVTNLCLQVEICNKHWTELPCTHLNPCSSTQPSHTLWRSSIFKENVLLYFLQVLMTKSFERQNIPYSVLTLNKHPQICNSLLTVQREIDLINFQNILLFIIVLQFSITWLIYEKSQCIFDFSL